MFGSLLSKMVSNPNIHSPKDHGIKSKKPYAALKKKGKGGRSGLKKS
jgi:hypothetical protein